MTHERKKTLTTVHLVHPKCFWGGQTTTSPSLKIKAQDGVAHQSTQGPQCFPQTYRPQETGRNYTRLCFSFFQQYIQDDAELNIGTRPAHSAIGGKDIGIWHPEKGDDSLLTQISQWKQHKWCSPWSWISPSLPLLTPPWAQLFSLATMSEWMFTMRSTASASPKPTACSLWDIRQVDSLAWSQFPYYIRSE